MTAMSAGAHQFPGAALPFLRCPVCGMGFFPSGRSLRCERGHSYDVARQGYVNLLSGDARPGTADTADMVAAREAFLTAGHFAGMRDFICRMAGRAVVGAGGSERGQTDGDKGCIVEVGAGTGYYLAATLDRLPEHVGLALDISKFAARRAARAHARMAAVVCDAWSRLPLPDGAASLVLDIFAPRNAAEFRRILRPNGALLVVTPSAHHLHELITGLGLLTVDGHKSERLEQALGTEFILVTRDEYEEQLTLTPADTGALAAMGPSARHLRPEDLAERLAGQAGIIKATLSVVAATYVPRTPPDTGAAAAPARLPG